MTNNSKKQKALLYRFLALVAVLIVINIIASKWFTQLDLTADKRYSTTSATTQMLQNLKGKVSVTVYLKGDKLPAAFKNLANGTEELLKTFNNHSKGKVSYRFVDPTNNDDAISTLQQFRMNGFPVTVNDEGGMQQRMVFPWALITFIPEQGEPRQMPVLLQESNSLVLNKQILLRSEMMLEYNLGNAIRQLAKDQEDMVAYVLGNGEATPPHILGMIKAAGAARYGMDTLNLQSVVQIPNRYKAIIIVQPTIPFSDVDLFKIDQYIMNGGRVLMAIDATLASIDSFQTSPTFSALKNETNINSLLFPYGLRINNDLVLDASLNAGIPVAIKGEAQPQKFSWPYYPVLEGNEKVPMVKNLQGVLARFPSSIDFNKNNDEKVKKTALLQSSTYSRTVGLPAVVMYNQSIMEETNFAAYNKRNLTVAALLEGKFISPFAQHQSDELKAFIEANNLIVKNAGNENGKLIVISDADILLNEVLSDGPADMGQYRFEQAFRFDNASFFQNALTYLVDDDNLLEARTKTYQDRILDPKRAKEEKNKWQILSIGVPVALVALLGLIYPFLRKRKYAGK